MEEYILVLGTHRRVNRLFLWNSLSTMALEYTNNNRLYLWNTLSTMDTDGSLFTRVNKVSHTDTTIVVIVC